MKEKKGVTLIELIVSIVIFGIIVAGVAMFSAQNTRAVIRSERSAKRTLLKERTIEEYKSWLKSASVPGSRFDTVWTGGAVGDTLRNVPDTVVAGIAVRLEINSFIPDQTAGVSDAGVRLEVNVISTDSDLNINDTTVTLISRHD